FDPSVPDELVYSGTKKVTSLVENSPLDAGKLVLSPTRTYAPVIKESLRQFSPQSIHGMIHCSGGAQTKILHFIDKLRVGKNNLLPGPPLFNLVQEGSQTDWKEMYQVLNMGDRLELYVSEKNAQDLIDISEAFNVDAHIVGHVEASYKKELRIERL